MEMEGIEVDSKFLKSLSLKFEKKIKNLEKNDMTYPKIIHICKHYYNLLLITTKWRYLILGFLPDLLLPSIMPTECAIASRWSSSATL